MVVGEGAFAANQALELLEYTPFVSLCTQGKDLNIPENFLENLKKHNIEILQEKIESLEGKRDPGKGDSGQEYGHQRSKCRR